MPGKPFQSKLEPFHEFIRECRAKRWSYQKIAEVLTTEKNLSVGANTVFSFVKVRAKRRRLYILPPLESAISSASHGFFNTPQSTHETKRKYHIT